jgi:hypothetical protein
MLETLFLFSLGITFLLILLLIYHFKNRLSGLEQKHEVLLEIMNTLVQETHMLKAVVGSIYRPLSPSVVVSQPSVVQVQEFSKEDVADLEVVEDLDLDDVEEEEDLDDVEEEEDLDEDDDEDLDDDEEIDIEDLDAEVEAEVEAEEKPVPEPKPVEEQLSLEKMKLPELRALAMQRKLTSDASKLKKPQLLDLLR